MTYRVLKLVFYILLVLPILVIGTYFVVRLCQSMGQINRTDKRLKEEKEKEKERQYYENLRKQNFYDDYDKNKGYR